MEIKHLTKKQIGILVAILVFAIIIIAGSTACIVKNESPIALISNTFNKNEDQIVGKWESTTHPGLFAYEFYEDGTYKNYSMVMNFTGEYKINGNKLTLINPKLSKEVVYKASIGNDEMKLTLIEEDGTKPEEKTVNEFKRVEYINLKTLGDLLNEQKNKVAENSTTNQN